MIRLAKQYSKTIAHSQSIWKYKILKQVNEGTNKLDI